MQILSFEDALQQTADARRYLLLGNGFSIALFPGRFQYGSLLEEADFSESPEARAAFDALETTDFEVVIRALLDAVALLPLYSKDTNAPALMRKQSEALKDLLVAAIAGRHPERPSDIEEDQYKAGRTFLAHFIGDSRAEGGKDLRGKVYTLNYDLLLYWALLHDQVIQWGASDPFDVVKQQTEPLLHDDGFRAPADEPDAPFVTWEAEGAADRQNIHFLHGALHLYDDGPELQKICWERSGGVPLVDQIRAALADGKFPLFVSEGASSSKLARIRHSGYLQRSLKSFAGVCRTKGAHVFVFGHSLAANDDHVLGLIARGTFEQLFVSIYGDPAAGANQAIINRALQFADLRKDKHPLDVQFFDAESAHIWS